MTSENSANKTGHDEESSRQEESQAQASAKKTSGDPPLEEEENDQPFSGDELDEPAEPIDEGVRQPQEVPGAEKKSGGKKRAFVIAALALGIPAAAGLLYQRSGKEEIPQVIKKQVKANRPLVLGSFIIPLKKHNKFTYISLGVSFNITNQELVSEMTAKREQLRAAIYDTLEKEVNGTDEIPSLGKMKASIIRQLNRVLAAGGVHEAYIIDFLAV